MLRQAFGEHSLGQTAVFELQSRFRACQVSVEDDEHSGWPITSKTTENVGIVVYVPKEAIFKEMAAKIE